LILPATRPQLPTAPLAALVVAGGTGTRIGGPLAKQFLPLAGEPIIFHTLRRFLALEASLQVCVVMHTDYIEMLHALAKQHLTQAQRERLSVAVGGPERTNSVRNGLSMLAGLPAHTLVAVQDAVRPFANPGMLTASYASAAQYGSGVAAVGSKSSLRKMKPDGSSEAVDRSMYYAVQTPQTFTLEVLQKSYAFENGQLFTDDASLVEAAGYPIHLVEGAYDNIKITTPEDLQLAELLWPVFQRQWLADRTA